MLKPVENNLDEYQDLFRNIQKRIYYWKKNPENNEIHLKKGLNINLKEEEKPERSILGVEQPNE